jgi:YegS/Rv2252/BmrU family lipid kinase
MPQQVRSATILVNLAARGVSRRFDAGRALAYVRRRGLEADLVTPGSAAEATRAAREAAFAGRDLLLVVGGDGTLRDAADGLAGSSTALAAIPAGTANVWAKEARIPRGLRAAFDAHLRGQRVRMDLGRAGNHPFLLVAGAGWDAEIARRIRPAVKRRLGVAAYLAQAALTLPRLRPPIVRWEVPGRASQGPLAVMVLSNTRLYGGLVEFSPGALADDGLLDVCALEPRQRGDGARLVLELVAGRLARDRRVTTARVPELTIETPGLPVQLDGDPITETPLHFTVEPRALLVSMPAGPLPPVFSFRRD